MGIYLGISQLRLCVFLRQKCLGSACNLSLERMAQPDRPSPSSEITTSRQAPCYAAAAVEGGSPADWYKPPQGVLLQCLWKRWPQDGGFRIQNAGQGWWELWRMLNLQDRMLLHMGKEGEHQKLHPPHTDLNRSSEFQLVLILSPQMCH